MTVLHRNAASGVNLRGFGKIFGVALVVAVIAAGTAFMVDNLSQDSAPAALTAERAAELNALNRADGIGIPGMADKADAVLRQKAASQQSTTQTFEGAGTAGGSVVNLADRIEGYPQPERSGSGSAGQSQQTNGHWYAK